MAGFKDFMAQRQASASGTTEPLDMGQGTRPRLTFKEYMEQKAQPQVSPETVKDMTAQPVGRPATAQPQAPQEQPQAPQEQPQAPQEQPQQAAATQEEPWYQPALESAASAMETVVFPSHKLMEMYQESPEVRDWVNKEALPTLGGMAAVALAPETGGLSLLGAMATVGGAAAVGGAAGEAVEQTAKYAGIMPTGIKEEKPKDALDVLKRSGIRGVEEGLYNAVPEMLTKGVPMVFRKVIMAGGKPAVNEAGDVVNIGKHKLTKMMREYSEEEGLKEGQVLTAADVAHVPAMDMFEQVSANSYIVGDKYKAIRATQEEAIQKGITKEIKQYLEPAKGYVKDNLADDAIEEYVAPNMDVLNDFGISMLIDQGFNKTRDAQKSVASAMYTNVIDAMKASEPETIWKEVEIPNTWDNVANAPRTEMVPLTEHKPTYPVDLTGLKKIAQKEADISLDTLDPVHAQILAMPDEASFEASHNLLVKWRAKIRGLDKATTEEAPVRKMHLSQLEKQLDGAMEGALETAHADGVRAADGSDLMSYRSKAEAIWKENTEDFKNTYIAKLLKATNHTNGAPEKLANMVMQNEVAAKNVMKIIEDGKASLKGKDLEAITQAENAIKGSVVKQIFAPFDKELNEYVAPNVTQVFGKKNELTRLFGKEGYDSLKDLAHVIEEQSKFGQSNYLGFAQRARESGSILAALKGLGKGDFRIIPGLAATAVHAMASMHILTNVNNIRYATAMSNKAIPLEVRYGLFRNLVHQAVIQETRINENATDLDKERARETHKDNQDYTDMIKGMAQGS